MTYLVKHSNQFSSSACYVLMWFDTVRAWYNLQLEPSATIAWVVPEKPGGPFSIANKPYNEIEPESAMPQPNSKTPMNNYNNEWISQVC